MERRRHSAVWRSLAESFGDTVREHCRATGDYESDIAERLGISPQYLSNQMTGTYPLSADILVHTARLTGDAGAVATVARLCGGAYVPLPTPDDATVAELADTIQSHAATVSAVAEIYRDGRMDRREARDHADDAVKLCQRAVEHLLRLRAKLEADRAQARTGRAASLAEAEKARTA